MKNPSRLFSKGYVDQVHVVEDILVPTQAEVLSVLDGSEIPLIEHANFFNGYYGLPEFNIENYKNLHPARVALTMVHYERYAREMGWISNA